MGDGSNSIEAPGLLIATPQVQDPFFNHAVVLLLQHSDEGSFGFNLNRPTELEIQEVLEGLDIPWGGDPEVPVYFGGPVQPQLGTVLFRSPPDAPAPSSPAEQTATEILPGLLMSQHVDDLAALAQQPPAEFRLFLGYAGWGAGQLLEEILRNDWILAPVQDEYLFGENPRSLWSRALRASGVDPNTLPSWIPDQRDSEAN